MKDWELNNYIGPKRITLSGMPPARRAIGTLDRNTLPIIAFDPGGTTGWSLMILPTKIGAAEVFSKSFEDVLKSRIKWEHGEIDCENEDLGVYQCMKLISEYPSAAIVVEDFILRTMRREMQRNLLSPVRISAKIEHYLWRRGRRIILQQPSMAKTTVTDQRLKLWNCYAPGMQHARDADRHILTIIRRCFGPQGITMKLAAWPHIYHKGGNWIPTGVIMSESKGVVAQ